MFVLLALLCVSKLHVDVLGGGTFLPIFFSGDCIQCKLMLKEEVDALTVLRDYRVMKCQAKYLKAFWLLCTLEFSKNINCLGFNNFYCRCSSDNHCAILDEDVLKDQ